MNDKAVQNKMFQKQAKTTNNEGTYSISCFSIAPSHCFRYPNPALQASSYVLQLAASAPFLLALLSLFLSSPPLSAAKAHAVILCFGFAAAGMADHFAVMAGRLLTESTLQYAIDEASDVPSSTRTACDEAVQDGRLKSGVLVECRICQEEDDETYMETPCSCKGSLKYAHRKCIQRWCDEKGDTICEICLQQFTPNYTAPSKLFQHGRNSIFFRTPGYIQAQAMQTTDQTSVTSTSYEHDNQTSNAKGVICCRIIAITLMVLLVLHDAITVFFGDHDAYTVAMITLLMLRTAGIVIPVYIILVSVTELLHRRNQRQAEHGQISEPGGAESVQPVPLPPHQQHVISIQ